MTNFFRALNSWSLLSLIAPIIVPTISSAEAFQVGSLAQAPGISLSEALVATSRGTPAILAQRELIEAARRDRSTRWLPREPTFSFSENDYAASQQYSLALAVPFPLKVWQSTFVDDVRVQNSEREYRARLQDSFRTVTQAYVACAADRETLRLANQAGNDLTTLASFVSRQYESGFSSQSEKIGVELQLAQARNDLENARISSDSSCRRWSELTQSLLGEKLPAPSELPSTIAPEILRDLGGESIEQLRADQTLAQAQVTEKTAFWSQAPDILFSVNRNHYLTTLSNPTNVEWTSSYMISMSIPIFFPWNERTEIQRARAVARQDQESAKIAKIQAANDQSDNCKRWLRGSERIKELEARDLPMAEAWIESTEAAYRRGRVGFAEILLARKTIFDLRNQLVTSKSNAVLNQIRSLGAKCS